jgi:uncharacterized protein YkwD
MVITSPSRPAPQPEVIAMKTWSMPAVLFLLSSACVACGARQPGAVPAASASSSPDESTPPRRDNLNSPATARPVRSASDSGVAGAVVPAEGVQVQQWTQARQARREQRQSDPRAHAQAEKVNQARESELAPHVIEAMEALEAALIEELGLMRSNPAAYMDVLSEFRTMYRGQVVTVPGYMAVRTHEGVAAVDDAIAMAGATPPMPKLTRSPGLSRSARAYAFQLGHETSLGRGNDDSITLHGRLDAYGRVDGMFAENVGAVYRDARLMLLELFVDDGVDTRVHRYNMIGSMFRVVGVGCAPHPKYDVVCVMDFAESYREASASARR